MNSYEQQCLFHKHFHNFPSFSIHFPYMFHHVPSFSFIFHHVSIYVPSFFHRFSQHVASFFHHVSIIFPYIFPTCSILMYHLFQAWRARRVGAKALRSRWPCRWISQGRREFGTSPGDANSPCLWVV